MQRRYPIGAEIVSENETHFRVWAPKANVLEVVLESSADGRAERTLHSLARERDGYFSGTVRCGAGTHYRFRLNGSEDFHPDPASRFQPEGPHGSSCVVDPFAFKWTDANWRGVK
ncbi:MAG: malto-oligosyltrehalose trehalohydrolase, partial [Verrucomicrobia bacterium]